jgi:hypothetical protein
MFLLTDEVAIYHGGSFRVFLNMKVFVLISHIIYITKYTSVTAEMIN